MTKDEPRVNIPLSMLLKILKRLERPMPLSVALEILKGIERPENTCKQCTAGLCVTCQTWGTIEKHSEEMLKQLIKLWDSED